MQSFSFVVGRFFFITSKPSCLRFCLEDSFDEQVEFEVVILVVLVQMIIITKEPVFKRTSSLGFLKGPLGRSVGLH
jgi:hypothetical protein